ncbi:uncharacterized protein LOC113311881 [Papaver somniferum]|uniref:uncharacterized protein LOC113311881 n=1 Tax=Papaver somniferum TaxID=3469 RepID=UPI000E6FFD78|nr:uncharacterized protein LOC113311881 [Papaver somniferum]
MRQPTTEDTKRLLAENEARGFPGMLGSLYCTHWEWKYCPTEEFGRHVGHIKKLNLVLQAVASYDRWFWHCYFGEAGANNDLNVLAQSRLFDRDKNALSLLEDIAIVAGWVSVRTAPVVEGVDRPHQNI